MDKNFLTALIVGLVGVVIWVGFSVYFASSKVDTVSNATSYVIPIDRSFNRVTLDRIMNKIDQDLPIKPQEIRSAEQEIAN